MTEMAPEQPVEPVETEEEVHEEELSVNYEYDDGVLVITFERGLAQIQLTMLWPDDKAFPGEDLQFLFSVAPSVVAHVHQEVSK